MGLVHRGGLLAVVAHSVITEYNYLGNIVRAVSKPISDIFANNHEYLRNKARSSIFSILKNLRISKQ